MPGDPALQKILNLLGPEKGQAVIDEVLRKIGCTTLSSPDDRYRFACELMTRGGVLEAVGRSIKIQAIFHGAKETPGR
jgi:hypothetical protein